jgi:hypothetical protein
MTYAESPSRCARRRLQASCAAQRWLPPEKGWPGPQRVRWFRTFAMNVSQIYDGDGEPVEMKIDLEKAAP